MDNFYRNAEDLAGYGNDWIDESLAMERSPTGGSGARRFLDVEPNISVKSDYTRDDYNYFRSSSSLNSHPEIMNSCQSAYSKIGIIKTVIDLMGDFASKGIKLVHPNKQIQNFYNQWWKIVEGSDRSERFLNNLYRLGNVVLKQRNARIPKKKVEEFKKLVAEINFDTEKPEKFEIPCKYDFLNPATIKVTGGGLSTFIGKPIYSLVLSQSIRSEIAQMENKKKGSESQVYKDLPEDLKKAIKKGDSEIILDQDKLHVYHYKKDDWQTWANPIIFSIWDDLVTFEKMRLADLSALDGAISNIRLWQLGIIDTANPKNSILPNREAINKLKNILHNNIGGGSMDLVWGPELKFIESNTQVYRFLGSQKYETVLNCIYDGIGIPSVLRSGSKGGTTNSFMALKTLVERLEYGRMVLVQFWQDQIEQVRAAMGFKSAPIITFDQLVLSDEPIYLKLLMDLADRDIISHESILEKFDMIPIMEKKRILSEKKKREVIPKASPFHNPEVGIEFQKNLINQGVAPNPENGKYKPTPGSKTRARPKKSAKKVGISGRPKNITETKKRKKKPQGKPRVNASFITGFNWANSAYNEISQIVVEKTLLELKKKDVRSLTREQAKQLEDDKFLVLCGHELNSEIQNDKVYKLLEVKPEISVNTMTIFSCLYNDFLRKTKKEPKIDELRNLYISAYVTERIENGQD